MKKQFFTALVLFLFVWGCSSSKSNTELLVSEQEIVITKKLTDDSDTLELTEISGTLNYSGNEPFTVPTIFVSDTLSYKLMGDETFINETYPDISGSRGTLYGTITQKGSLTYFQVHYYTIMTD